MKQSIPDMLLQAFVILMCFWGIYNKWIAPRIDRIRIRRLLPENTRLLEAMLTAPAAQTPVTLAEESQVLHTGVVETSSRREYGLTEDEDDSDEEEEFDGTQYDDRGDLDANEDEVDDRLGYDDDDDDEEPEQEIRAVKQPASFPKFVAAKESDPNASWNGFVTGLLGSANHLIVIGASGGGKTVTMYDLVRNLLENSIQVVVCDPDAAGGDWPGADVYGGGDDFDAINGVLAGLHELMKERRRLRVQGIREFEPMWFIFDEYSDIKDECTLAATVVENGLRRARKLNIHLMIGVQDTQVKTMGFERKSSLLEHARIIKLIKRMDNSRILRLDDETTIKVPKFDLIAAKPIVEGGYVGESDSFERGIPKFVPITNLSEDEEEDDETVNGDGKEQIIRQLLLAKPPWSYQRIVTHMGTSSARISRIKHKLEDEGLL